MHGSTYFIQAGTDGPIKIGYTERDPEQRVRGLQTGSPVELVYVWSLPGNREREFHARFAEHRLHGEWFDVTIEEIVVDLFGKPTPEQLAHVGALIAKSLAA